MTKNFFIGILLFLSLGGWSQGVVKFDHYTTRNGLPDNHVFCILKDSYGYVWLGTDQGLARFDGSTFTTFQQRDDDSTSLAGNKISSLFQDKEGLLWVGLASDKGVDCFDYKTERFTHHMFYKNLPLASPEPSILSITQSSDGRLWFGGWNGVSILDKKTGRFERHPVDESGTGLNTLSARGVFTIIEDHEKQVWLFTFGDYVFRYRAGTNDFEKVNLNAEARGAKQAILTKKGSIMIMCRDRGVLRFDSRKRSIVDVFTLPMLASINYGTGFEAADGTLWLGSDGQGISLLDPVKKMSRTIRSNIYNNASLSSDGVYSLYGDSSGMVWAGTFNAGLNVYDPSKYKFSLFENDPTNKGNLSSKSITAVYQDSKDRIWLGTDGDGLWQLDEATGEFKVFRTNPADLRTISSNVIISICEDNFGNLLLGTWQEGMNVFDPKTGINRRLPYEPDIKTGSMNRNVWNILKTREGVIYVGFLVDKGHVIRKYDDKRQQCTDDTLMTGVFSNILALTEDASGKVWVGTADAGAFVLNKDGSYRSFPFVKDSKKGVSSSEVRTVFEDKNRVIWFGTAEGLDAYNPAQNSWRHYSLADGLPSKMISSILQDDDGFLWLGTSKGITKFDPRRQVFFNFDENDGLQPSFFNVNSCVKTRRGRFYFGGAKGLNSFDPRVIHQSSYSPKVIVSKLYVLNKQVTPDDGTGILRNVVSQTDTITLSYKDYMFSLEFSAMVFSNQQRVRYAYKLEGFDKTWNYCGNERKATYTNIDQGTYTFKVRATNGDGVWGKNIARLVVVVVPPYWRTLWFKVLMTFVLLSGFVTFYYIRMTRVRALNAKLKLLVEERTEELRLNNELLLEKNNELNERQQQIEEQAEVLMRQKEELMVQRDQLYDVNMTKDRLFSIIGHDLRNPFTAIQGYSELLISRFRDYTPEKIEAQLGYIREASNDTLKLLNNLLDWSKSQRGVQQVNIKTIDFVDVFMSEYRIVNQQASLKKISLDFSILGEKYPVNTDDNIAGTVMRNLVSNAIKYSPVETTIFITLDFTNQSFVMFSVRDQGVGIAPEKLKLLFNGTLNVSTRGTSGEKGTGLGLVLCHDLVAKLGGTLWAESTPGVGSTFFFSIPSV